MSDRSFATITYPDWADLLLANYTPTENYKHNPFDYVEAKDLWQYFGPGRKSGESTEEDVTCDDTVSYSENEEANGGEHDFEDALKALKVPFDSWWGDGGEYREGSQKVRLDRDFNFDTFTSGIDINDDLASAMTRKLLEDPNWHGADNLLRDFVQETGADIAPIQEEEYNIPQSLAATVANILCASWEANDEADEEASEAEDVVRIDLAVSFSALQYDIMLLRELNDGLQEKYGENFSVVDRTISRLEVMRDKAKAASNPTEN